MHGFGPKSHAHCACLLHLQTYIIPTTAKLSFESGNLAVAQCDNPNQYTLLAAWQQNVRPPESGCMLCVSEVDVDANTDGYTQWFYFAVRGGTVNSKINFRLINMAKSSSLFGTSPARQCCQHFWAAYANMQGDKGMRPVIWSEKSGRGWERGCSDET